MSNNMWRRVIAGAKLAAVGAVVAGVMAFSTQAQVTFDLVPLSPALLLFLTGLAGIGFLSRV